MNALPPNAGKGRPKGIPNKMTRAIKEMVGEALEQAGGVDYLVRQSEANPAAFMALVAKIIPKDSNVTLDVPSPKDREALRTAARAEVAELFGDTTERLAGG